MLQQAKHLLLTALVVAAAPQSAVAQRCEIDALRAAVAADLPIARRYAPVYWFSPGERYLPTVPFFAALDGVDNDSARDSEAGVRGLDFQDPDEIAPEGPNGRLSWNALDSLYAGTEIEKAERSAIFYRVRDTLTHKQLDDIWRHLKSDEQAWRRIDIDRVTLELLQRDTVQFRLIEYYAYYLSDFGLIGHPYDVELVYVFLPQDERLADRFRIIVGGGHTQRVPNNVLVLSGKWAERQSGVNARPTVIVELGDHSSAPDVLPYGRFRPSLDANWHDHDLWGTRDVQASSGLGALGNYQLWMTFPRDTQNATRLLPPAEAELREMKQMQLPDIAPDVAEFPKYSLVPAEAFECLFDVLGATTSSEAQVRQVEELIKFLVTLDTWRFKNSSGFNNLSPEERLRAVTAMKKWNEDLYWSEKPNKSKTIAYEKHQVWKSDHYQKTPTRIFKSHLFRPVLKAMWDHGGWFRLANAWLTWYPDRAVMLQAGVTVPAFWLPIRLPGYLEAQAGVYSRCKSTDSCFDLDETSFAASLLHTGHYNHAFSWYARLSFIPRRRQVDRTDTGSDWFISGGLSLIPVSLNTPWFFDWLDPFRVRLGIATELASGGPRLSDSVWELQLGFLR